MNSWKGSKPYEMWEATSISDSKETQELRTCGSQNTRVDTIWKMVSILSSDFSLAQCAKEKSEDKIRVPLVYQSQPFLRSPKATEQAQYPLKSYEEAQISNWIIRKLIGMREKLAETRREERGRTESIWFDEREKKIGVGQGNTEPKKSTWVSWRKRKKDDWMCHRTHRWTTGRIWRRSNQEVKNEGKKPTGTW